MLPLSLDPIWSRPCSCGAQRAASHCDQTHGTRQQHVAIFRGGGMVRFEHKYEAAMGTTENLATIRSLTDAELDDVSGGIIPVAVGVAAAVGALAVIAIGWGDLPVGMTQQQAAAAMGLSHLF